jgi:hypothetical protein
VSRSQRACPVAPDAVYVWRGFKPAAASYADFTGFLGTVFVPACVLLQPRIGLSAYLPALLPQAQKPAAVPDQTALMFWRTPQAHDQAKTALAERIYSNLHGNVYDMARSTLPEVPQALDPAATTLVAEQPYYLLDVAADWMDATVHHLVGARASASTPADFLAAAATAAAALRRRPPAGVDGLLLCCGNDYLAAWAHGAGSAPQAALQDFAALVEPVLSVDARALELGAELWDDWPAGLDLSVAPCLNLQFERPHDASPRAGASR